MYPLVHWKMAQMQFPEAQSDVLKSFKRTISPNPQRYLTHWCNQRSFLWLIILHPKENLRPKSSLCLIYSPKPQIISLFEPSTHDFPVYTVFLKGWWKRSRCHQKNWPFIFSLLINYWQFIPALIQLTWLKSYLTCQYRWFLLHQKLTRLIGCAVCIFDI